MVSSRKYAHARQRALESIGAGQQRGGEHDSRGDQELRHRLANGGARHGEALAAGEQRKQAQIDPGADAGGERQARLAPDAPSAAPSSRMLMAAASSAALTGVAVSPRA